MVRSITVALLLLLSACGGSGGGGNDASPSPTAGTPPPAAPPPTTSEPDQRFATRASTGRFLAKASFGATPSDLETLTGTNAADWFVAQLSAPISLTMPQMRTYFTQFNTEALADFPAGTSTFAYWRNVLNGPDQLRQRVAYALSQILVVSNGGGEVLTDVPSAVAYYMDVLATGALGNYRDLLEQVTYTPAMGHYLTYMGNQKGDPATGRVPDENYAREILQLFTIGTVQLNADGSPQRNSANQLIETYSNADITGLAKVFTGLDESEEEPDSEVEVMAAPMIVVEARHSQQEKSFLGSTIPANTRAASSITQALDIIFAHPNLAPFVGRQLIQRLITSHPEPAYVARVSVAFEAGQYELPNGVVVGEGRRGDLAATVAAVLFDEAAHPDQPSEQFGKIREPIIRFTQWARAYVPDASPEYVLELWDTTEGLAQHPYRAKSVFNFYRPGYVAPGTATGGRALTMPELQIVGAASIPAYANFMNYFASWREPEEDLEELTEVFAEAGVTLDPRNALTSFVPNYQEEIALANQPDQLLSLLDEKLTHGALTASTRDNIEEAVRSLPADDEAARLERARLAVVMVLTSVDFLLQQ